MHPILAQLGPIPIHTYGFLIATGFILADYCWGMAAFRPERDPRARHQRSGVPGLTARGDLDDAVAEAALGFPGPDDASGVGALGGGITPGACGIPRRAKMSCTGWFR